MTSATREIRFVLGVDGGGTKTSAWIATAVKPARPLHAGLTTEYSTLGEVLAKAESGPGNPKSVGADAAQRNILSAIERAIDLARQADPQGAAQLTGIDSIDSSCLGLAGVGRPEDKAEFRAWLGSVLQAPETAESRWLITDDIEPIRWAADALWRQESLQAAARVPQLPVDPMERREDMVLDDIQSSPWSSAITLIAGTGSIARGESINTGPHPQAFRAGGWGYILGDEGSGYAVGLAALRSICQQHDLGGTLCDWQNAILQSLKLKDPTQIVSWIYQPVIPRREVANLATFVLAERNKDETANAIMHQTIDAWVHLVATVSKRMRMYDEFGLAIAGGIPSHAPDMVDVLIEKLRQKEISPATHRIVSNPVLGCLAIAAKRLATQRTG